MRGSEMEEGGVWVGLPMLSFVSGIVCIIAATLLLNFISKGKRRRRWAAVGKDVVVLHMPSRSRFAPSMSPFVLKLETFLRFAKINYKVDTEEPFGPEGTTPWITLNGEEVGDSEVIIAKLIKHFNLTFDLSEEQRVITTSFITMLDHHFVWGLRVWRYIIDRGAGFPECQPDIPKIYLVFLPLKIRRMSSAVRDQGLGRLDFKQVLQLVRQDLIAIALYLGKKPYLLGVEPGLVDCVAFGHLANLVYNYRRSPFYTIITEEMPTLVSYVDRMKEKLWPDWEQHLAKPR